MDLDAQAVDSPLAWAAGHTASYLASDGRDVDHPYREDLVLLYVKGRSSGVLRRFPVVALRDDGDWLVVASRGGSDEHPQWYLNMVADPEVWVRDGAAIHRTIAVTLAPEEREAVWPRITQRFSVMADYQQKTERILPVVRLVRQS